MTKRKNENERMDRAVIPYRFTFDPSGIAELERSVFGRNWPVTYLIHNEHDLYVGESSNVSERMRQHQKNSMRQQLTDICILYGEAFNKSVILDLEATLILLMQSDQKFHLQNLNSGQSLAHDYYQKGYYDEQIFPKIWESLREIDLADQDYETIVNSNLFKFSPYHSLTTEQYGIAQNILLSLAEALDHDRSKRSFLVGGSAGTGKSVLAVFLFKRLHDLMFESLNRLDLDGIDPNLARLDTIAEHPLEMGFVVPQPSLRKTYKEVFKNVEGLKANMVLSPSDVLKKPYDLLIIDESHRLKRRKALTGYGSFDQNNRRLGLGEDGTELDWILASSRFQIFLYDQKQMVKPSDIEFNLKTELRERKGNDLLYYSLNSQLRVLAGNNYIDYIHAIFSNEPPEQALDFSKDYSFLLYEHIESMIDAIQAKNATWGLSRLVAGYAWPWKTKNKKAQLDYRNRTLYDFQIEGKKLIWNSQLHDWVNSAHALEEVGCVHTVQGYDLNYVGVILGPDLTFDEKSQHIKINETSFYDVKVKNNAKGEELKKLILNAYEVLLTRGIRGTFIYACDPALRHYLKRYIPSA